MFLDIFHNWCQRCFSVCDMNSHPMCFYDVKSHYMERVSQVSDFKDAAALEFVIEM